MINKTLIERSPFSSEIKSQVFFLFRGDLIEPVKIRVKCTYTYISTTVWLKNVQYVECLRFDTSHNIVRASGRLIIYHDILHITGAQRVYSESCFFRGYVHNPSGRSVDRREKTAV